MCPCPWTVFLSSKFAVRVVVVVVFVAAAQVFEQDEDNDEEELKDTLIRIAKLSTPGTKESDAAMSLEDVVATLRRMHAISSGATRAELRF